MSLQQLRKILNKKTKKELIDEIASLYKKHDDVKKNYQASLLNNEDEVLDYYKCVIREEFYPKRRYQDPKCRLSVAKKAISDFKKVSCNDSNIADIMIYYVETGVRFTTDYGDIDERFYNSMESVFGMALKFIVKTNQEDMYMGRAQQILENTSEMGWGFHDGLFSIYSEYF